MRTVRRALTRLVLWLAWGKAVASSYLTTAGTWDQVAISGSAINWYQQSRITAADGLLVMSYGFNIGDYSPYLCTLNYGFAGVPSGATITGIGVTLNRRGTDFKDYSVKLIKSGTIQGNDKADTATTYPSTLTDATYGGDGDLWGLTLTDTNVKASNFGVAIACQQVSSGYKEGFFDYIGVTVYYSTGGGTVFSYGYWSSFGRPLQHQEGY